MGFGLMDLFMMFFIYAFLGWCCEVVFAAAVDGKFVNRGFLNGPVCPIYGVGVVAVIILLTPLEDNLAILFFGSVILTSALEFATGWVLEKLFSTKWWDYSRNKFNLKGYICLEFSLLWGLAATFVMRIIHPMIYDLICRTPDVLLNVLVMILGVIMLADGVATVAVIRNLQKRVRVISALAGEIHSISDRIGGGLSGVVLNTKQLADETQDIYADYKALCEKHRAEEKALFEEHRKAEQLLLSEKNSEAKAFFADRRSAESERLEQKKLELKAKLTEKRRVQNRILRAFPNARLKDGQDGYNRLVSFISEKNNKKD